MPDWPPCKSCGYQMCNCPKPQHIWIMSEGVVRGKPCVMFKRSDDRAAVWYAPSRGLGSWVAGLPVERGGFSANPQNNAERLNWLNQPMHTRDVDAMRWADEQLAGQSRRASIREQLRQLADAQNEEEDRYARAERSGRVKPHPDTFSIRVWT